MKKLVSCLMFWVVVLTLLAGIQQVFRRKGKTWEFTAGFWAEPKNTIDVLCIGSSHAYCSWNPLVMFRETGVRSYCLGSPSQPVEASYAFLKEAFRRQRPKVVLLETFTLKQADGESKVARLAAHNATDQLDFGRNKSELINAMRLEDSPENYYFDFLQYHSRWKELSSWDFSCGRRRQTYHGYQLLKSSVPVNYAYSDQNPARWDKGLSVELAVWLDRINQLVVEHGARLVVFTAPFKTNGGHNRFCRALARFLQNRQIPYFNFLDRDLGLVMDGKKDFYDNADGHLNWIGADKLTARFARILVESGIVVPDGSQDDLWQADLLAYESFRRQQIMKRKP